MTFSILAIAVLNVLIILVNISNLYYSPLLLLFNRNHLNDIPIIIKSDLEPCVGFVKSSDHLEFATPCKRAQGLTSIADAPFFISLVLMSLDIASAVVLKFGFRDAQSIIDNIESEGALLDKSHFNLFRVHFDRVFDQLSNPYAKLIVKAWWQFYV